VAAVCGTLQAAPSIRSSQCGSTLDFTPINSYQGEIASVQDREEAVDSKRWQQLEAKYLKNV